MASHQAIVLIRGVNVGGNRKLPMADLRALCEDIGCSDVVTYIQSGNIVLRTSLTDRQLAGQLAQGVEEMVGFRPSMIVRRPHDLRDVLDDQPFGADAVQFLHVGFLAEAPTKAALASLTCADHAPEAFALTDSELYLYLPLGMGRSPMMRAVPFERRLGVGVTIRNWRTVAKLAELSHA